jgi:hypothetical protein
MLSILTGSSFATFDIIGDLAFGEPFGCLETSQYHSWVSTIFQITRVGVIVQSLTHYPLLKGLLDSLGPFMERMDQERQTFLNLSRDKLKNRIDNLKERPDLVENMIKRRDELVGCPM